MGAPRVTTSVVTHHRDNVALLAGASITLFQLKEDWNVLNGERPYLWTGLPPGVPSLPFRRRRARFHPTEKRNQRFPVDLVLTAKQRRQAAELERQTALRESPKPPRVMSYLKTQKPKQPLHSGGSLWDHI